MTLGSLFQITGHK